MSWVNVSIGAFEPALHQSYRPTASKSSTSARENKACGQGAMTQTWLFSRQVVAAQDKNFLVTSCGSAVIVLKQVSRGDLGLYTQPAHRERLEE